MTQKAPEYRDIGEPFPSNDFWEELVDTWEDFSEDDALGDDYAGRIFAIETAIRAGHLPAEAAGSIVSREQITQALTPLQLSDPTPVVDQLWTLAGRYLRPLHRKLLGSDPAATRRQLAALIKAVIGLERALDQLPPVTIDFLQRCHARLPASHRTRRQIDFGDLDLMLSDIGHTAYFADLTLVRDRRQPPKLMRTRLLREAVRIIEQAADSPIRQSWSRAGEKRFVFIGEAGEALRNYMQLVEPASKERALVEDLIELRKAKGDAPV